MDENLKKFLKILLKKRYIGGKHTPESRFIKVIMQNARPESCRSFDKEYGQIINEGFVFRLKKRTGKGSDWHVSLNPEKLGELSELLSFDEANEDE